MQVKRFASVVIGSGQGGFPLAMSLAARGEETALIEERQLGGTCVNTGCTPTKTMVASARAAYVAARADDFGVQVETQGFDLGIARKRKRSVVEQFRSGSEKSAEQADHLTVLYGTASFSGPNVLEVSPSATSAESLEISASRIFINTGTSTNVPPINGLSAVPFLDNESLMELEELPEHLLILGGGYLGVEFGQMFRRFGSDVTIIQRSSHLLPREDDDIAEAVQSILAEDGIRVLTSTETSSVRISETGRIELSLTGRENSSLEGSHLLIATGRKPNTERLNLGAAGVATDDHGHIVVNDRLETSVPGVWALGDVKGGPAFTHISYDDSRIIERNLWGDGNGSMAGRIVPYTVFMDPQLGRVGMTEEAARKAGYNVKIASMPMTSVARALEVDEARGLVKAVIDAANDRILGFAMLGIEGGEIAGAVQLVMLADQPYTILRDTPFAHPTVLESMNNLFAQVE